jgi:hypothetical protein
MTVKVELFPECECDYDVFRNCNDPNNNCDICRCARLHNVSVTNSTTGINNLKIQVETTTKNRKTRWKPYKPSLIERYCLDRILRHFKVWDPSQYDVEVVNGYYGEEIGSITHNRHSDIVKEVEFLLNLPHDIDRVKHVLQLEYQFMLDVVLQATSVTAEKVRVDSMTMNTDYAARLKKHSEHDYRVELVPMGVVVPNSNGTMRLIDGYHRLALLHKTNEKAASYLVLRP